MVSDPRAGAPPATRARARVGDARARGSVVMAKTRRRKRRTHVDEEAAEKSGAKDTPRSLVFARGRRADAVRELREDVRRVRIDRIALATARRGVGGA